MMHRGTYDEIACIFLLSNRLPYSINVRDAIALCSAMPSESSAPHRPPVLAMMLLHSLISFLPAGVIVLRLSALWSVRSSEAVYFDDERNLAPCRPT